MFFTRIGILIAWVLFVLSGLRIATAVVIAFGSESAEQRKQSAVTYLATSDTGVALNQATMYLFAAVILGVMCEISKQTRLYTQQNDRAAT